MGGLPTWVWIGIGAAALLIVGDVLIARRVPEPFGFRSLLRNPNAIDDMESAYASAMRDREEAKSWDDETLRATVRRYVLDLTHSADDAGDVRRQLVQQPERAARHALALLCDQSLSQQLRATRLASNTRASSLAESPAQRACDLLGDHGMPEAIPALVPLLQDPHGGTRKMAALALGATGDEAAIPGLITRVIQAPKFYFADVGVVNALAKRGRLQPGTELFGKALEKRADLQTLLAEPHAAAFTRRVQALEQDQVLRRFCRGFYVHEPFDLPTLSQRLAPSSYVSFGTVLAQKLLLGTRPDRQLIAAKVGRARTYRGLGYEIVHLRIAPHLDFGHTTVEGVKFADAEKAALDVLYFHLRGRRYPFDVYSDIDYSRLDRKRVLAYLARYKNPKFVAFGKRVLVAS